MTHSSNVRSMFTITIQRRPFVLRTISNRLGLGSQKKNISSLAHEWICNEEESGKHAPPDKTAIFLHGLLGNRKNWRSLAQKFIRQRPGWQAMVVDLRGHGESTTGTPPHGLPKVALDLQTLVAEQLGGGEGGAPERAPPRLGALCGHSFGGKAVLEYLQQAIQKGHPLPSEAWIFDTIPGEITTEMANVTDVLDAIQANPPPFPDKDTMVQRFTSQGIPKVVALWLTTNLRPGPPGGSPDGGGLEWVFDVQVARSLFASYTATGYLPLLRAYPRPGLHLVRATKNAGWTPAVLAELEGAAAANPNNLRLHALDAGHWLHVEDPQGLLALMA